MPPEIQTAEVAIIVTILTAISSILGAYVHSLITRKKNQDTLAENQTTFEATMLKNQAAFDEKYQSFFVDRVSILLDERKQLWNERSKIAEEYLAYQKDASSSNARSEEAIKRLELQLASQADKLIKFEKDIVTLTADRESLSAKFEKVIIERDNLQVSYRQSQDVILKQQAAVSEMGLLKNQYSILEKRVFELEANEKELTEQVHTLEIGKATLEKEVSIYKADRDRLIEILSKIANGKEEANVIQTIAGGTKDPA